MHIHVCAWPSLGPYVGMKFGSLMKVYVSLVRVIIDTAMMIMEHSDNADVDGLLIFSYSRSPNKDNSG